MGQESIEIYERVLAGERWPEMYVGSPNLKDRGVEILKYLFFEKLKITEFEEAQRVFDVKFIRKYRLQRVIACIEKPVEFLPGEYDYILWELFPHRRKGKRALTIKVYSEVLAKRRNNFPRGFFTDAEWGRYRAEVCVKYLCKNILHFSGEKIAREFSHSNGIKTLARYRLKILLNLVYTSLFDMMYQVYPQYCDKLEYYQYLQDGRYHRVKKKGGKRNGSCKRIRNTSGKVE